MKAAKKRQTWSTLATKCVYFSKNNFLYVEKVMKRKAKEDKTERSETKNWDFTKITHTV